MGSPALQAIYRYGYAHSFPIDETATFAQIAAKCGRDEAEVRRFLRMAMTYRVFKEPEPGVVAHTAASKALVQRPLFNQWVGMWLEELGITLASVRFPGDQSRESEPSADLEFRWLQLLLNGQVPKSQMKQ